MKLTKMILPINKENFKEERKIKGNLKMLLLKIIIKNPLTLINYESIIFYYFFHFIILLKIYFICEDFDMSYSLIFIFSRILALSYESINEFYTTYHIYS
jgi:hypothetical protein